jgi:thymidylate synthase (FAD)
MMNRPEAQILLLDHGYVHPIEHWGSDERIIEAARMSTGKGFNGWGEQLCPEPQPAGAVMHNPSCPRCKGTARVPGDEKLLAYLYDHKHSTPFEMAGMVIEVKAPIFVFREWHRHRTQSYNEMSARYIPLPDENYIPSVERLMMQGGANKQAQSTGAALTAERAESFQESLEKVYALCQDVYAWGVTMGVPKELARCPVPVARYSRMRASANLRNWLQFLTLRMHPAAQWEIRQYANAVGVLIAERFPHTWALFAKEQSDGAH